MYFEWTRDCGGNPDFEGQQDDKKEVLENKRCIINHIKKNFNLRKTRVNSLKSKIVTSI